MASRLPVLMGKPDVDLIEGVPGVDRARLEGSPNLTLHECDSTRIIYLHMDSGREKSSPFVTDRAGKPLEANPLRDVRVRKALSMAIDRESSRRVLVDEELKKLVDMDDVVNEALDRVEREDDEAGHRVVHVRLKPNTP